MSRPATIILVLSALGIALLTQAPAPPIRTAEGPLLPKPGLLHAVLGAQQNLVADYFWILTAHQAGSAQTVAEFRDIYAYANVSTLLDPRFRTVYAFAAVAMPVHVARDTYANGDLSTLLLRRGLEHFPNDFRIRFQLAYNLVFFHKAYVEAAEHLKVLAGRPDSPRWLGAFAARLFAQAGQFDASEALARNLRDNAEDEETQQRYDLRLKEIEQEKVLRRLDDALATFKSRNGREAIQIDELVETGVLSALPVDPLEGTFFIGSDGRARSTSSKFRLEVIERKLKDEARP